MGLGLQGGGVGAAEFFSQLGARVLVTDLRTKQELEESIIQLKKEKIKFVLGQHRPEDFIDTDLVIKNPAIPANSKYLEIAKKNKVAIDTDVGIFFELCKGEIIGVTGTKGKSTVSSLIARFLRQKYNDVVLAGNIRDSVLKKLKKINKESLVVLELSSWQLAGLRQHQKSPGCALITNFMPDHLNRYTDMTQYLEDKKEIFKWQKKDDYLILNYDDQPVRDLANETKSQVLYYSQRNREKADYDLALIENSIQLRGKHNISNVLAAATVAKLYNVFDKSIIKVLNKFKGLEGRLEFVAEINRVEYINDTTATTPEACLAALDSFDLAKDIILIAGGSDKRLDFSQLAETIIKRVKVLILLNGNATDKLEKLVGDRIKMIGPLDNMEMAVKQAQDQAQENDLVLLSPACASFGLFRHEFERGKAFVKAVDLLNKS